MIDITQDRPATLDWVLILAPYRKDASYTASLLRKHNIRGEVCSAADLADLLAESPGVIVVTHEALKPEAIGIIAQFVRDQPNWSEIPIVVLLDRAASQLRIQATLHAAWPRSRPIFYQRPMAALELVSGIQSALLTRFRQREVRDYLERETEMRRELNHRVKNILAGVLSIFDMTRRVAVSTEGLATDFRGRLTALANVHTAVTLAGGEDVSLADVAASTLAPYTTEQQTSVSIDGPDILVSREASTTLALCLHELATNAIKYGALSRPEGHVRLRWEVSSAPDPLFTLQWDEAGGPPPVEPSRTGYGTRFLRSALSGLLGERPDLVFAAEGLRCTVRGPLSRISPRNTDRATSQIFHGT